MPLRLINQQVTIASTQVENTIAAQRTTTINPATLESFRNQLQAAQNTLDARRQELIAIYRQIAQHRAELAQARTAGQSDRVAELETLLRNSQEARVQAKQRYADAENGVMERQRKMVQDLGTVASFSHLGKRTPIALLPVRIETRYFAADAKHYELRLRIFPDHIHVDDRQSLLTQTEYNAGQRYWEARQAHGAESEAAIAHWQRLCEQFDEARAFQIVSLLDPSGMGGRLVENLTPISPPSQESLVAPEGWVDLPKVKALPDRWAIVGYRGNQRVMLHWTEPIPPELQIALELGAPGEEFQGGADALNPDAGIEWLTDFQTAERVGMAARIRVNKTIARSMERILVFGISASQTPAQSAAELESLLDAHAHSGLDFALPGSPTNNTRRVKTEYRHRKTDFRQSHQRLLHSRPNMDGNANATILGRALGIDPAIFRFACHATHILEDSVKGMYWALWLVSFGNLLKHQIEFPVAQNVRIFIRDHFLDYVRPRGVLPTLRLRSQPYGVLPIVSLQRWKSRTGDLKEIRLVNGLRSLLTEWLKPASQNKVPRLFWNEEAPNAYEDPQRTLVKILSMSPTSTLSRVEFAGRTEDNEAAVKRNMQEWWNSILNTLKTTPVELFQILHGNVQLFHRGLFLSINPFTVQGPPVSSQPDRTAPLVENYIAALATRPNLEDVRNHRITGARERSLLYLLLRHAYIDAETNPDENSTAFFSSLPVLQNLPVETLEMLLTDVMDASTYRLDAWVSSIANLRLKEVQNFQLNGVHIGGYGWVEGLEPPGEGVVDGGPVRADPDSAGYLHLPSVAQAKTAAVLHGAFLAHEQQHSRDALALNLDSDRVRIARWLLAGIRQGQTLGALLGYRLERRLTEKRKGQFISNLRTIASLSTGPIQSSSASVTADVADGLAIDELNRTGGLRSRLGSTIYNAIAPELVELDIAQDALSDLLIAEGVHQAVNGNSVRSAAAFDAMADGSSFVDEPEVTATPATGISIEHRVAVVLPTQPQSSWAGDGQRLRAIAEPRLNAWAAALLGNPDQIHFRATYTPSEGAAIARPYTLADFDICPLDVVYLSSANPTTAPLTTLLQLYLQLKGLDGQSFAGSVRIEGTAANPDESAHSLNEAIAIAYSLLRTFSQSRPLAPTDLTTTAATADVQLQTVAIHELETRTEATRSALAQIKADFSSQPTQADRWWKAALIVGPADPTQPESLQSMMTSLEQRQTAAEGQPTENPQFAAVAQITAILGKEFKAIAPIETDHAAELDLCLNNQSLLLEGNFARPKQWLQDYARVRPGSEAIDLTLTLANLLGHSTPLSVGQLPLLPGQVWIGDRLSNRGTAPHLSVVAHTPYPISYQSGVAGLLVDSWSEIIPNDHALTGLAFHYDEPKAQAPQSILLALPPTIDKDWQFEDLEAALLETFDLIKVRSVKDIPNTGRYLPALTMLEDQRPHVTPSV
ncbi:MAG: hypothetical protein K6T90_06235 [Leptolyngbyaceae cyanobacterium HOT.MB2.61]|nr:hypothetical protein [Leptolyngbyaceae cyanobacterium HOT.MB2.61]